MSQNIIICFQKVAHEQMEISLLKWLSYINAMPMELEFSIFRANHQTSLGRWLQSNPEDASNELYTAFIKDLQDGRVIAYLKKYPVLARLFAMSIDIWIETSTELITRVGRDQSLIENRFNLGSPTGNVVDILLPLSDRHHGGRSVAVLLFDSGLRLVYKPKDIGIEEAFNDLVGWLNSIHAPVNLKPFKVLNCGSYGWAEFVQYQPCSQPQETKAYYKKAGGLLFLAHVLCATDLHHENIIQQGKYPVLIDLETLLHPYAKSLTKAKSNDASTIAEELINHSVLRTGLLPRWFVDGQSQVYDASGLGQFMPQQYEIKGMQWYQVNTDAMKVCREAIQIYNNKTRTLDTSGLSHFKNELVTGFEEMYFFFCERKETIFKSAYWQALAKQQVRFVFRPTRVYSQIQHDTLQPTMLKKGADRSQYLSKLQNDHFNIPPEWRQVVEVEVASMEQMDIPHFLTRPDTDALFLSEKKSLPGFFEASSYQTASSRLLDLNQSDLNRQLELIRGAIRCRTPSQPHRDATEIRDNSPVKHLPLTSEQAIATCTEIARSLEKQAIYSPNGGVTWIAPRFFSTISKHQLEPLSYSLYDGTAGVGLFFAALYRLTNVENHRALAFATIKTAVSHIKMQKGIDLPLVGGYSGYVGLLYSIFNIAKLIGDSNLIDVSLRASSSLDMRKLETDPNYDVMHGNAGTILGLLPIYEHKPNDRLLQILCKAGDQLVQSRTMTPSGFNAWCTSDQIFLTGFSHGSAGIAYSLLRLFQITGIDDYRQAASEAIAYEQSVFCEPPGNWPDFRPVLEENNVNEEYSGFMCTWCHGATGIGLARLASIGVLDNLTVQQDIKAALKTTVNHLNMEADQVCCGNFGRLELLLSASTYYNDQTFRELALGQAGKYVALANLDGNFRYNSIIGPTPGFFQGVSGIGYQLLRLTNPQILPSVLTLR